LIALERIGCKNRTFTVPIVIAYVKDGKDRSAGVRARAVAALGRIALRGDPAAVAAATACLPDHSPEVRVAAMEALGRLARSQEAVIIAATTHIDYASPVVRAAGITALQRIADEDGSLAVAEAAGRIVSTNSRVREAALADLQSAIAHRADRSSEPSLAPKQDPHTFRSRRSKVRNRIQIDEAAINDECAGRMPWHPPFIPAPIYGNGTGVTLMRVDASNYDSVFVQ